MQRFQCMSRICKRYFHVSSKNGRIPVPPQRNEPLSGVAAPRCGGIASMMRLPIHQTSEGLDVCFVGVPLDAGTTNRSGTRMGPRQIRTESVIVRKFNNATGASPFDSLMVGDVGDMAINMFDLPKAVEQIKGHTAKLIENGCKPLVMGGDHTISYPILQAMKDHKMLWTAKINNKCNFNGDIHPDEEISTHVMMQAAEEKYGKVGMIHVDAHTDLYGPMADAKIHHGNPFLLAVEEDLLDCNRVIQIGLRGSGYSSDWVLPRKLGFKIFPAAECWWKSLVPLMEEVRQHIGDGPVYISFDIDAIDPAFCPGTGTPEIGGLTTIQALEIIRGLRGLNIIGCDLVEVSPPYDRNGTTALTAANLLYEMLCVLPGAKYFD